MPKETQTPKDIQTSTNEEISIYYARTRELWNHRKIVINCVLSFLVASEILKDDEFEQQYINQCRSRHG